MKSVKFLVYCLFFSFGLNAQIDNPKKSEMGVKSSAEQRAKFQTEKMKNQLNLSNEQYEKAYKINMSTIEKNQNLQTQKMTSEERRNAVKENNQDRMNKLKEILSKEQFTKLEEKINEKKSSQKNK
jgi:hypothetical protein